MANKSYEEILEAGKSDNIKDINTEPSHLENFLKMLRLSEYCTDFEVSKDNRTFQGDIIPMIVVSYLDNTNRPIRAIFLESTEDLIAFETDVEIKEVSHHH